MHLEAVDSPNTTGWPLIDLGVELPKGIVAHGGIFEGRRCASLWDGRFGVEVPLSEADRYGMSYEEVVAFCVRLLRDHAEYTRRKNPMAHAKA